VDTFDTSNDVLLAYGEGLFGYVKVLISKFRVRSKLRAVPLGCPAEINDALRVGVFKGFVALMITEDDYLLGFTKQALEVKPTATVLVSYSRPPSGLESVNHLHFPVGDEHAVAKKVFEFTDKLL
jgi:hypothetical protein